MDRLRAEWLALTTAQKFGEIAKIATILFLVSLALSIL